MRKLERERGEEMHVMIGGGCRGRSRKDVGRWPHDARRLQPITHGDSRRKISSYTAARVTKGKGGLMERMECYGYVFLVMIFNFLMKDLSMGWQ